MRIQAEHHKGLEARSRVPVRLHRSGAAMRIFRTEREAKEFLIQRIVEQARREGQTLTELEHKMLYFSESGWTLPEMSDINAEFERICDSDAYERKILALAASAQDDDEAAGGDAPQDWKAAVAKLSEGDHYLLVLINPSLVFRDLSKRPPRDRVKLFVSACAIVVVLLLLLRFAHASGF